MSVRYHYENSVCKDVLTKISNITYVESTVQESTASAYSLNGSINESTASDALAKSLLGSNYKKVDLTENGVLNTAGAINESTESSVSTYSASTNETVIVPQSTTAYTFEFDGIGNTTKLNDYDLNWNGRRLESISQDGTEVISYEYNIDGQRISKTYSGVTTEYFYNGSILAGQKRGDDVLVFMYDNNGDVFGFTYNGTPYYYE